MSWLDKLLGRDNTFESSSTDEWSTGFRMPTEPVEYRPRRWIKDIIEDCTAGDAHKWIADVTYSMLNQPEDVLGRNGSTSFFHADVWVGAVTCEHCGKNVWECMH